MEQRTKRLSAAAAIATALAIPAEGLLRRLLPAFAVADQVDKRLGHTGNNGKRVGRYSLAQQLADAFGVLLCVVTDGSRGSALAVGRRYNAPAALAPSLGAAAKGGRTDAVIVPIYKGVTQKDATGAGDAFFGGIIASTYAWGFPTTGE